MPDAEGLAVSFLSTRTWAESLQFCRDHPEVLGDDVKAWAELSVSLTAKATSARRGLSGTRHTCRVPWWTRLELGFANAELEQARGSWPQRRAETVQRG